MRGEKRSRRDLAALAERQHGVVAGQQLTEIGLSEDTIWREADAGRLHRLHRDVYAVGHAGVSREGKAMAAVLAVGGGALLSHRSAAWLWGLTRGWPEPVEVTAASRRHGRAGIRAHSSRALLRRDRASLEGIPLTAVPRTLLDLAAVAPSLLDRALDSAERRGLLDLIELDAFVKRSGGFRGIARLRSAMEVFQSPAFTRSGLERSFLSLVRKAGLPPPATNLFVEGYELDAYWAKERFAVELDTYEYHGGRRAFETDRIRQEDLKLAGVEMVRISGVRLNREPWAVVERLKRLLDRRRRELHPPSQR